MTPSVSYDKSWFCGVTVVYMFARHINHTHLYIIQVTHSYLRHKSKINTHTYRSILHLTMVYCNIIIAIVTWQINKLHERVET